MATKLEIPSSGAVAPVRTGSIRTLVVDDDLVGRTAVLSELERDEGFDVVGSCGDGRRAVDRILELDVKLVIADVQMPLMDAFQMLEHFDLRERPRVIFVAQQPEYAVRAFEFGAIDYVLKPLDTGRFRVALQRARHAFQSVPLGYVSSQVEDLLGYVRRLEGGAVDAEVRSVASPASDHLVVKAQGAIHFLKTSEVIWMEAQGDFVKVQTSDTTQLVRETLQSLEGKLDPTKFLRIHRSFVVNLAHVLRVETALYGDYWVFMSDGSKLRLSRTYRTKLKSLMRQRGTVPVAS